MKTQKLQISYTRTLADMVGEHGCAGTAELLGLTKAAVRQMLNTDRQIVLRKINRRWCYAELKEWKHAKSYIRERDTSPRSWRKGAEPAKRAV